MPFPLILRTLVVVVALVTTALTVPSRTATACEPVHTLSRHPLPSPSPQPVNPPNAILCWTGPCRDVLGDVDTMGRFMLEKGDWNRLIDYIAMRIDNIDTGELQTLVAAKTAPVCGPPAGTVTGCTARFKIPNVKTCPVGQSSCPANKITATFTTLDQINTVTTGGTVVLPSGQVVEGAKRNRFWLYYEVCCPDYGQFGDPGSRLETSTEYEMQINNLPSTCVLDAPRSEAPEAIPESTYPCQ